MGQDPNNPYGWSPGQNGWNPQPASQPDWNSLTDYGRQQLGMPTAAQWEQMRGGGQTNNTQPNYANIDFRAATYGVGAGSAADTNKSPGNANIGSGGTTTPANYNPMQGGQLLTGNNPWGGATNRLAGFGNTSLFGTPYGSGGSTGFGGTNPSQYRGAGMYGRAASYGQSQRPY